MKSVRFGGHVAQVIEENDKGRHDNYKLVMQRLQDPATNSADMTELLQQFTGSIHVMDKSKRNLVQEILSIKWVVREKAVIQSYLDFLVELISGNSVHQVPILQCLVKHFLPASSLVKGITRSVPEDEVFELIHATLRRIFTIIPMTITVVAPLLSTQYPFMGRDVQDLVSHMGNLFTLVKYQPLLRRQVLDVVVTNILKIDLECPRDVIRASYRGDDHLFDMELEAPKKGSNVEKFDALMDVILRYIREACSANDADTFVEELMSVFERYILPVHDSSHIQFIVFYICSLKVDYCEWFTGRMWKIFQNPNTTVLLRKIVLGYLASFFARSSFLDIRVVLTMMRQLSQWIHSYIEERESTRFFCEGFHSAHIHDVFYSACQALFYVIVFRLDEIIGLADGFVTMRKIRLERIVTCRLNPLKYCLASILDLFTSMMRQHQIVYCETIIQRNNRQRLPISGESAKSACVNPLDSFFPFDPYCLKTSEHFFEDIYREWKGRVPQADEKCDSDNDDDFMDVAINIPDSFDNKKSIDGLSDKIFGISPGFSLITPSPC